MKLNKRIASQDEHGRIANIIKWCKRHNQAINGFPYGDDLVGSDGIHLELLVPQGTSPEKCTDALVQGYSERDVVTHAVIECPADWFNANLESRH